MFFCYAVWKQRPGVYEIIRWCRKKTCGEGRKLRRDRRPLKESSSGESRHILPSTPGAKETVTDHNFSRPSYGNPSRLGSMKLKRKNDPCGGEARTFLYVFEEGKMREKQQHT